MAEKMQPLMYRMELPVDQTDPSVDQVELWLTTEQTWTAEFLALAFFVINFEFLFFHRTLSTFDINIKFASLFLKSSKNESMCKHYSLWGTFQKQCNLF